MNIHLKDPLYLANKNFYENHFHQMKLTSLFIKYLMKKYMTNMNLNKEQKDKKENKKNKIENSDNNNTDNELIININNSNINNHKININNNKINNTIIINNNDNNNYLSQINVDGKKESNIKPEPSNNFQNKTNNDNPFVLNDFLIIYSLKILCIIILI